MRHCAQFFILAAVICCGCSSDHFKSGHGDVGLFILKHAVARGGNIVMTNSLPPVNVSWRYSEDTNGVVIQMSRKNYPEVKEFLHEAFGEPKFGPVKSTDGGELGVYRLSSKGGGIQFGYNAKETHIVVIRPMSTEEILNGFIEWTKKQGEK